MERALAAQSRQHWLDLARELSLPVGPVHGCDEARSEALFDDAGLTEETPMPGDTKARGIGPWVAGLGQTPSKAAPQLGEHTEVVLGELGIKN